MNREFYRGGSRSPFRTSFTDGILTPQPARDYVALIAPGAAQDSRVKRVQVSLVVPSASSSRQGWAGFLRVPDQGSIETGTLDIDAPSVLRPKVFLNNADHAVYMELYLEAINLAAGEVLGLIGYANSSIGLRYAAKWFVENQIH